MRRLIPALLILCLPPVPAGAPMFGIGPTLFVVVMFVLGFMMSLGKAAVYKHIPTYYPDSVGAVGGLVGMIGGLGGFVLPLAFGVLKDATGQWTSCFALLLLIVAACLGWMHLSIRRMAHRTQSLGSAAAAAK